MEYFKDGRDWDVKTPSLQRKWISVKDRLPELDTEVLVFGEGNSYNSGPYKMIDISNLTQYYSSDLKPEGVEWSCKMSCQETVTHWMPLPEAPHE